MTNSPSRDELFRLLSDIDTKLELFVLSLPDPPDDMSAYAYEVINNALNDVKRSIENMRAALWRLPDKNEEEKADE